MSKNNEDDFMVNFLGHRLESYQFFPSEDGQWLGLILTVNSRDIPVAIPQQSLNRMLREIQSANQTLLDRQEHFSS
jgi:hypothetical protein